MKSGRAELSSRDIDIVKTLLRKCPAFISVNQDKVLINVQLAKRELAAQNPQFDGLLVHLAEERLRLNWDLNELILAERADIQEEYNLLLKEKEINDKMMKLFDDFF